MCRCLRKFDIQRNITKRIFNHQKGIFKSLYFNTQTTNGVYIRPRSGLFISSLMINTAVSLVLLRSGNVFYFFE